LQLAVGEEALTPRSETQRCGLELVVDDMNRLSMGGGRRPSLLNHLLETRHLDPEGLEAKNGRFPRAALVRQKEGQWSERDEDRA
jgi:hypothetical protein